METVGVWSATIPSDIASSNRAKASQRDIVKRVLERSLKYLYSRENTNETFPSSFTRKEREGKGERERESIATLRFNRESNLFGSFLVFLYNRR